MPNVRCKNNNTCNIELWLKGEMLSFKLYLQLSLDVYNLSSTRVTNNEELDVGECIFHIPLHLRRREALLSCTMHSAYEFFRHSP